MRFVMTVAPPRRFVWRSFTSVLLAACFTGAVFSGAVLFLSPPGRVANWTDWTIAGLTKREWTALHVSFSAVLLVVAAFHVCFNWRPLVGYFKDRVTRRPGWRPEWFTAVVVAAAIGWAAVTTRPPLSWLLTASEHLKLSWDQPAARAPVPHAELLTLGELASRAGVPLATATQRLEQAGLRGVSADGIVEAFAARNRVSARRVYEVILGQTDGSGPSGTGTGRGGEAGGGRGVGRGGFAGGLGWKTLEQFCADEGLDVAEVQSRLQARGIRSERDQTLRELANAHGFARPFELVELIRGSAEK
jgi:hypothetical protein